MDEIVMLGPVYWTQLPAYAGVTKGIVCHPLESGRLEQRGEIYAVSFLAPCPQLYVHPRDRARG